VWIASNCGFGRVIGYSRKSFYSTPIPNFYYRCTATAPFDFKSRNTVKNRQTATMRLVAAPLKMIACAVAQAVDNSAEALELSGVEQFC
jgi:hypothetical protein